MKYVKLIWSNFRPWAIPSLFHLPLLAFLYIILIDLRALLSSPDSSETPARLVLDWVERLPTSPLFFLASAALLGTYFGWRWVFSARLHRELSEQEKENVKRNLISDDWLAIRGLRRRAFTLRTQAGVILAGVIAFLLGGIYVFLFILPQIPESDRVLIEAVKKATFQERFGRTLQSISEGRYWLRVDDASSAGLRDLSWTGPKSHSVRSRLGVLLSDFSRGQLFGLSQLHFKGSDGDGYFVLWLTEDNASLTRNGGQTWETIESLHLKENEWLATAEFSPDGRHGIVAGDEGSFFLTKEGGETWEAVEGLGLEENEWIVTANLSPDGRHGIVAGDKGSVSLTNDGGETWTVFESLRLKENEWIVTTNVSPDGRHGIVAGDKGSVSLVSLTVGDEKVLETVEGLDLKENEWIVAASIVASFRDSGSRVITVLGNLGSVFVRKGESQVWTGGGKIDEDLRGREWISTTDMAGQFGLAGGTNGSVFRTSDWGQSWYKVDNRPLSSNIPITSVSISGDGMYGVVGNRRGEVAVMSDSGRTRSLSTDPRLILGQGEYLISASLDFDGRRGVAASNTGTMFVTNDFGYTWNRIDSTDLPQRRYDSYAYIHDQKGEHGVVSGRKNMVFMTLDGGKTWRTAEGVALTEGGDVSSSAFSDNGRVGVVGSRGSVFSTGDAGETWSRSQGIDVKPNERFVTSALSPDGQLGVLAGSEGSLFVTHNGGSNWFRPEGAEFIENESVESIFLLEGTTEDAAKRAVVVGNEGSVFATRDSGTSWFLAEPNQRGVSFRQGFSRDGY